MLLKLTRVDEMWTKPRPRKKEIKNLKKKNHTMLFPIIGLFSILRIKSYSFIIKFADELPITMKNILNLIQMRVAHIPCYTLHFVHLFITIHHWRCVCERLKSERIEISYIMANVLFLYYLPEMYILYLI